MLVSPSVALRPDGPPASSRWAKAGANVTKGSRAVNALVEPRKAGKRRPAKELRGAAGGPGALDQLPHAGGGGVGDGIGGIAPEAVEAAGRHLVLLVDAPYLAAVGPDQRPTHLDLLAVAVGRRHFDHARQRVIRRTAALAGEHDIDALQRLAHGAGERAVAVARRAVDVAQRDHRVDIALRQRRAAFDQLGDGGGRPAP